MIFNFGKLTIDTEKEPYRSEGIRIAFYSAPGTRKSYTVAACIIEPFLAESRTVVIFQPKSEWHTLKQKYSLIVVGGHFQDIPLAINQAKVYADAIVKHGVSMAFDFTETEDRDLVRFAAELLARIFTLENVERRPILLFFEELAEYCLPSDAEILTYDGWCKYDEVVEGKLALTLNINTGIIEYQPIQRVFIKDYDGIMTSIKGKTINGLFTPEHRVVLQTFYHGKDEPWHWKGEYEFRRADKLLSSGFRIPTTGLYVANEADIPDDLIRLLSWIIAEANSSNSNIVLEVGRKSAKHIRPILDVLRFKYGEGKRTKPEKNGWKERECIAFRINSKDSRKIRTLLENKLHEIPQWLLHSSARQLKLFFEEFVKADGNARDGIYQLYPGKNSKLADQLMELCIKIGLRVKNTPQNGQIHIHAAKRFPWHYVNKQNIGTEHYKGIVWDVTVPNGTFVARRKGTVFITGNCPFSVKGKLVEPWIYERMSSRIVKIATQGRALGINIVATSQRPAQLNFTVRMMMNLSLYGKFHPKDLNDIKEVLSHYELPTSPKEMAQKCVSMPHGSWIGITSEKVVFTKITATRVTPHGADTPKVEYVAPMTQEAQKTMDELTKTITDALEKEKAEESELDKAKEKIGDLEKKLRETEEEMKNLKIALTVAGSQSGSKGVDIETYNKVTQELERLRQERANIIEKIHGRIEDVFKEISVPAETRPSVSTMREEDLEQKKNRIYETWKNKFPSRAAERIFKYLLDNYPGKFTLSQIGVSLGYKAATSGSFGSAISFLRNNHLIVKDDKLYSASLG